MYTTDCLVIVVLVLCATESYCELLAPYSQVRQDSNGDSHLGTGSQYEERNKRSPAGLIKKLINQSSFWHTYRGTMVYTRAGGYNQALQDFYQLKPTSIREWGDGDKFGFVGDKTVTLIRDPDRASLSFWDKSSFKPDETLLHEKILYLYEL